MGSPWGRVNQAERSGNKGRKHAALQPDSSQERQSLREAGDGHPDGTGAQEWRRGVQGVGGVGAGLEKQLRTAVESDPSPWDVGDGSGGEQGGQRGGGGPKDPSPRSGQRKEEPGTAGPLHCRVEPQRGLLQGQSSVEGQALRDLGP